MIFFLLSPNEIKIPISCLLSLTKIWKIKLNRMIEAIAQTTKDTIAIVFKFLLIFFISLRDLNLPSFSRCSSIKLIVLLVKPNGILGKNVGEKV